ncbi:MAG: NAD-dependent succinate-semialdehyde dehydrogenase [Bacteroidia bacterium]|nr:NAD-dependent succinate-semialdehyde dehydrogenase [Bacteroidia bacterium]
MFYQSINPATNQLLHSFSVQSLQQAATELNGAALAFSQWKNFSFEIRAGYLHRLASLLSQHEEELAYLATLEMGKPLAEAKRELQKSAFTLRFFADHAHGMLHDEQMPNATVSHHIRYEPLGVIFGIFPWNFPYWQVLRFAAPALMAGNAVVIKHAPNVPQCALKLKELFTTAGFPEGVYTNLFLDNETAAAVIAHPVIKGVSLTGSEVAGSAVAAQAGKYIKPSVLELGGSDAMLVLPDADLNLALKTGVQSRFINSGQACNGAKRFILFEPIAEQFTQMLLTEVQQWRCVDPMKEQGIGPLARKDLVEKLEQQVNESVLSGAKILTGGRRVAGPGNYFEPTILTHIPANSPAYTDELFGPVISLFVVKTEQEAIALANDTRFGLDAGIFTADMERAQRIAAQLEVAQVYINSLTRSIPELPFGGTKSSGYGRELSSFGIRTFVNIKTIVF